MKKLLRFWHLPTAQKLLLSEAAFQLGLARLLIRFLGHERWSRMYGRFDAESAPSLNEPDVLRARQIGHAVRMAARWVPWKAVCLPQALAAKWMLGRRNIPSTLYVGLRRPKEPVKATGEIELHAWLRVGGKILTGGELHETYQILARYG